MTGAVYAILLVVLPGDAPDDFKMTRIMPYGVCKIMERDVQRFYDKTTAWDPVHTRCLEVRRADSD